MLVEFLLAGSTRPLLPALKGKRSTHSRHRLSALGGLSNIFVEEFSCHYYFEGGFNY